MSSSWKNEYLDKKKDFPVIDVEKRKCYKEKLHKEIDEMTDEGWDPRILSGLVFSVKNMYEKNDKKELGKLFAKGAEYFIKMYFEERGLCVNKNIDEQNQSYDLEIGFITRSQVKLRSSLYKNGRPKIYLENTRRTSKGGKNDNARSKNGHVAYLANEQDIFNIVVAKDYKDLSEWKHITIPASAVTICRDGKHLIMENVSSKICSEFAKKDAFEVLMEVNEELLNE